MGSKLVFSSRAVLALLAIALSLGTTQTSFGGLPDPLDPADNVLDPADAFGTPGTPPNVTVCPRTKPFRCENGDCVTNPTKCRPTRGCPLDRPLRCNSGRCASRPSDCEIDSRCPVERPVRCPKGGCVADRGECSVPALDGR